MVVDKVEFDVLAHDRASDELSDIAGEFRKLSRDADGVGKSTGLADLQKKLKAFSDDVDRQAPKNAAQLDKIAAAYKRLGSETDDTKRNAGLESLSRQLQKITADFEKEGGKSGDQFGNALTRELHKSETEVEKEGTTIGRRLSGGLRKWFTGGGAKDATDAGKFGGTVFGSGFLGVLKTPILGPAVVAAIGATVATVMPAVGAVAAGALVAGFGVGIGALGLVFAAKSDAVKAKWKSTMTGMGTDLTLLSKPFEATLLHIATYAQRSFNTFKPALGKAFSGLAEPIDRFADDALRALDRFEPSIAPIVTGAGQVLQAFGGALPGALGNISDGFAKLAESVASNPDALADTVTGIGNIVRTATDGITILNDLNGKFETLTGGTSAVDAVMALLNGTVGSLFGTFGLLNKALDALGLKTKDYKAAVDITGQSQSLWTQGLNDTELAALGVNTGATAAAGGVQTLDERVAAAKKNAADYTQRLNDWITAMFRAQGLSISLAQAQIGVKQAYADASKAVKENGKNTNLNTQAGRDNKNALIAVANAANSQTEAMNRSKVGIAKSAAAAESSRANFVRLAEKMGYSKEQANAMAAAMIAIPSVTREAKLKANIADLESKLTTARNKLDNPKLTATKRAKIQADIAQLEAKLRSAQGQINNLHGTTITVGVRLNVANVQAAVNRRLGSTGYVEGRAVGGPVTKGTPYLVGENRRTELFVPDEDGTIIPDIGALASGGAGRTMVAGGNAGIATVVFGSDGSKVGDFVLWLVRETVQKKYGGDVVKAFGGR